MEDSGMPRRLEQYQKLRGSRYACVGSIPFEDDFIGESVLESLPRWKDRWQEKALSGRRWQYTWAAVNGPQALVGMRVLDAGADDVSLQYWYARSGAKVTSMDCCHGALKKAHIEAEAQGLALEYRLHDICMPLDAVYDVVTCLSVLEHIEDWQSALRNLCQAVDFAGYLLLTVDVAMPGATVSYFSPEKLQEAKAIIEACGFLVQGVEDFSNVPQEILVLFCGQNSDQPLTWAGILGRKV
jgi:SAM-dependent methyltransferase